MFGWLKRLFGKKRGGDTLVVIVDGQRVACEVVEQVGPSLVVSTPDGRRIVNEHDAVDGSEFRRIWRSFGVKLYADGVEVDPSRIAIGRRFVFNDEDATATQHTEQQKAEPP